MPYPFQIVGPSGPDGERQNARIPDDLVLYHYKHNPAKYENFRGVEYVLNNPNRIFSGILREFTQDGYCYVGKPANWWVSEKRSVAFRDDFVFVVYLTDTFWVQNFRAEFADSEDPLSPEGWRDRYRRLNWKRTS